MSKKVLPTYSICSLTETPLSPSDFMADRFDHYLEMQKDLHFPHKHSFFHLVYFSESAGSHSIDFIHFPLEWGQIYFMVPGQVHTWDFKNEPNGFIVNFSEQYINSLIANPMYLDQFTFFRHCQRAGHNNSCGGTTTNRTDFKNNSQGRQFERIKR